MLSSKSCGADQSGLSLSGLWSTPLYSDCIKSVCVCVCVCVCVDRWVGAWVLTLSLVNMFGAHTRFSLKIVINSLIAQSL